MTVAELRKALEGLPDDALVLIEGEWPYYRSADDPVLGTSALGLITRVNEGIDHISLDGLGLKAGEDKPYVVL